MSNQEKMPFVEALESYKEQHFCALSYARS